MKNCTGFSDGNHKYVDSTQEIQFVQKNLDGTIIPGVQSEQLALILLDRARKLNARFPSVQNGQMIDGLQMFIEACEDRVRERMDRGVMGDLKK
jgi:ribosome assembly protein YihI (activator of Der GTPase)